MQQGHLAAQDGDLPAGALHAQHLAELGVQVAQVVAGTDAQAVGRVGDHPTGALWDDS